VRSAGASVAASIATQAEDEKDQVGSPPPHATTSDSKFLSFCFLLFAHSCCSSC
jgi:hypothetical protein